MPVTATPVGNERGLRQRHCGRRIASHPACAGRPWRAVTAVATPRHTPARQTTPALSKVQACGPRASAALASNPHGRPRRTAKSFPKRQRARTSLAGTRRHRAPCAQSPRTRHRLPALRWSARAARPKHRSPFPTTGCRCSAAIPSAAANAPRRHSAAMATCAPRGADRGGLPPPGCVEQGAWLDGDRRADRCGRRSVPALLRVEDGARPRSAAHSQPPANTSSTAISLNCSAAPSVSPV